MATKIKLGNGNWGVKENGLLAYNDEDNIFKAIEMNHSRSSTATRVNSSGTIVESGIGVPRIDFSDSSDGALLLEPQSTNLITYSEDFSDASWTKANMTVNSNTTISPNGTITSDLVIPNTDNVSHPLLFSGTYESGKDYTYTIFAKPNGYNFIQFFFAGNSFDNTAYVNFDIANGVVGNSNGTLEASIGTLINGFYRCVVTITANNSNTGNGGFAFLNADTPSRNPSYAGDGTSGVYLWGAQLEELSYPTSYIRTEGSAVTRIADAVTGNSSLGQVINSSEGVLYGEIDFQQQIDANRFISIGDGTANNRIVFGINANSNDLRFIINSLLDTTLTFANATNRLKFAFKYKSGDHSVWINGVEVFSSPNAIIPTGMNGLYFNSGIGTSSFYGRIRDLRVYNTALTDAELSVLTSL